MKDLTNSEWQVKTYSRPFAVCKVDVDGRTFSLMIDIFPNSEGVDGEGSRASLGADAIVIDGRPKPMYAKVELGMNVLTPFGTFNLVDWNRRGNYDWIKVVDIADVEAKAKQYDPRAARQQLAETLLRVTGEAVSSIYTARTEELSKAANDVVNVDDFKALAESLEPFKQMIQEFYFANKDEVKE